MATDYTTAAPPPGLTGDDLIFDRVLDDPDHDLLNHRALVGQLARLVGEVDTSVNIALFGPWGSGKSSVGALLAKELRRRYPWDREPIVSFVRYDAWRYAGVSLQRSFIAEAARDLGLDEERYHRRLYQDRRTGGMSVKALLRVVPAAAVTFVLVLLACVVALAVLAGLASAATPRSFVEEIEHQAPTLLPAAAFISLLTAVLRPFLDAGAYQMQEAAPTASEQFRHTFTRLIDDALAKERQKRRRAAARRRRAGERRWRTAVRLVRSTWQRRGEGPDSRPDPALDPDRVVFFIDELDRCSAEDVVEALRALKTFLDARHCVFVVAADRDVIEAALDKLPQATPTNEEQPYYSTAGAFLDKVFQYQITLPPVRGRRLTRFARDLVAKRGGLWAQLREPDRGPPFDEVVYALIPSHVRSLRRVKVLLNRFAANARIAEANDLDWRGRADEIAKLTVLETEFPGLATDLRLEPRLPTHLLNPPQWPSPLLSVLLERHSVADGEASGSLPAGARPTSRLLTRDGETRLVRTQHAELSRYLRRTATIRDPGRDLLYLETAGKAVDLEDAALADKIEELAPESPDDVVAAVANHAGERPKVTRMLADMVETAVGGERRNVMSALLRTFELIVEQDEARRIAWEVVAAVRVHRMDQPLPRSLVPAALEAAEWSQRRTTSAPANGGRDADALSLDLLRHVDWDAPDAVRRVAQLADHLELGPHHESLAEGFKQRPDEVVTALGRLTAEGVRHVLSLPAVATAVRQAIGNKGTTATGLAGESLARQLYDAGGRTSEDGKVYSYSARPLLEHVGSAVAYRVVAKGAKQGDVPGTEAAASNVLGLLALRTAPPADWSFWANRVTILDDHTPEEEQWALEVIERVFAAFPRAKPDAQKAAVTVVTRAASLVAEAVDQTATDAIAGALEKATGGRWWVDKPKRDAHARLHRAARALREKLSPGTQPTAAAAPLVEAIDRILVQDLDAARRAGAAADPAVLDEIVKLAGQLPGNVGDLVVQELSAPERRAQWSAVGRWGDVLRELGAGEPVLEALFLRMSDDGDASRFERLATVFAPLDGAASADMGQTVEMVVRVAAELGDAGLDFAIGHLTTQAATAPDQIREAYRAALAAGAVAPPALDAAVIGATAPDTGGDSSAGLRVTDPSAVRTELLHAEVVVVGSGAGGSMAAVRLAEGGRRVLVLERGRLVDSETLLSSEVIRLVGEDPLRAGDLRVLRTACVGGATLLSHGVASDPSPAVLSRWNDEHGAGLDESRLRAAIARLRDDLQLPIPRPGKRRGFSVKVLPEGPGMRVEPAAIARLSTVHGVLPRGQAAARPGGFEIIAECRAERLITHGRDAVAVECRLGDGKELRVEAEAVVVAAGAIRSSSLLQVSGIGGEQVGRGIGFNVTAMVLIEGGRGAGADLHGAPGAGARRGDQARTAGARGLGGSGPVRRVRPRTVGQEAPDGRLRDPGVDGDRPVRGTAGHRRAHQRRVRSRARRSPAPRRRDRPRRQGGLRSRGPPRHTGDRAGPRCPRGRRSRRPPLPAPRGQRPGADRATSRRAATR